MIRLSRYNSLEMLWNNIKENNIIPEEIRAETEDKLLRNKLEVKVDFCDQRIKDEELRHKLAKHYDTIALVDPLIKDTSVQLGENIRFIVTDPTGVIISCQSQDIIGYCCPAANLLNNNKKLKNLVACGNIVEVNYDNGIQSQLIPIFNEEGEIQFFWGVSDYRPISPEVSNILYLAAQVVQQRYQYAFMIDEYTSSFMNALSECAVILDEKARIIDVNNHCLELLKMDNKDTIKGMHISEFISIENLHAILTSDNKVKFILHFYDEDIPCQISYKQYINGPYGNELVLLFGKISDNNRSRNLSTTYGVKEKSTSFDRIVGTTPEIKMLKSVAQRAARSSATILIEGESGTGKELFAEAIHQESKRQGKFLAINCGGIPAELIQSELFGYEDGAFTGARKKGSPGKFEIADGGTLFLDEIGEMPVDMQVSLLRFLQDKTITRVGGHTAKKVDVRIIAATNRNLIDEVEKGNFRKDLYYRLNVINLHIPPLRKRKEDIPLIANYLLKRICDEQGIDVLQIDERTMDSLIKYDWPGNARELENAIERAFILRQGEELLFDDLAIIPNIGEVNTRQEIEATLKKVEKEAIEDYLRVYRGNISQTANALGITRQTLYRKIKALNIDRNNYVT